MKYTITHTCGHQSVIDIIGTNVHGERDRKVAYHETTLCDDCYYRQQAAMNAEASVKEVKISYRDYKNIYADYDKKPNSYDARDKTIIIYVPTAMDIPEAI